MVSKTQGMAKKAAKAEQIIVEEFIKDLEVTAKQIQVLLTEIQESKIDFATIKTELKFVIDNVQLLSSIIRGEGENGSVLTRLSLVEQSIQEIKIYITKDADAGAAINTRVALLEQKIDALSKYAEAKNKESGKKEEIIITSKWKLYITLASGTLAIIGSVIALILQSL